ncbi:enoyl-CoA hydratase/isomerase family protein [Mesobacterium pallidum]|uniref:enoyl-CoA hydratase/isomerase family protein n=1 Tax=Mesobacterium pallidum TaxID=2872037 RepID=UPI001EE300DF|nr:enoyl-CoA hydratase-related protein [Mesobacterium pallidum]
MSDLPTYETLLLTRAGRRLTITFNQPEVLNAFGAAMHREITEALVFAAADPGSDVIVLTGAGRAFSAGGDIARMQHFVDHPDDFAAEAEGAKRLIYALLEIDKPLVARINGPAVGLGATIALFCDVTFASETAKIGDPHVAIGLVAGDGGAVIWPQLVGMHRAKEFLLTGELLTAARAAEIGLINHVLPDDALDTAVDAFCAKLLAGSQPAIRWTKVTMNLELKRLAHALMDPGMAYESLSVRTEEHRARVQAFAAKARKP